MQEPGSSTRSDKELRRAGLLVLAIAFVVAAVGLYAFQHWSTLAKIRKLKNPVPTTAQSLATGLQLYRQHCQSCHGARGDGRGQKAPELSVAPGDFTDVRKMHGLTDGELYWQITKGESPMPAFERKVSQKGRWALVDYIRTFAMKPSAVSAANEPHHNQTSRP